MEQKLLPSKHQIGDYVEVVLPPVIIRNCKVESVKFKENSLYYDLSVLLTRHNFSDPQFSKLTDIQEGFVYNPTKKLTLSPLQSILYKMDAYKTENGFIAPIFGGEFSFFEKKPSYPAKAITRKDILRMIDEV